MKFLTGVMACGILVAGFAASAPSHAAQLCSGCVAAYEACVAKGGDTTACWKCNNPTCQMPNASDPLHDALARLSAIKAGQLAPASKRPAAKWLDA